MVIQILLGGYLKVCQSIFILGVKLARSFWKPAVGDPPKLGFPNCGVHQEKASISLSIPGWCTQYVHGEQKLRLITECRFSLSFLVEEMNFLQKCQTLAGLYHFLVWQQESQNHSKVLMCFFLQHLDRGICLPTKLVHLYLGMLCSKRLKFKMQPAAFSKSNMLQWKLIHKHPSLRGDFEPFAHVMFSWNWMLPNNEWMFFSTMWGKASKHPKHPKPRNGSLSCWPCLRYVPLQLQNQRALVCPQCSPATIVSDRKKLTKMYWYVG